MSVEEVVPCSEGGIFETDSVYQEAEVGSQMQLVLCPSEVTLSECMVRDVGVKDQGKHVRSGTWRRKNRSTTERSSTQSRYGKVASIAAGTARHSDSRSQTVEDLVRQEKKRPGWMDDVCISITSNSKQVVHSTMFAVMRLAGQSPPGLLPLAGCMSAPYNPSMMIVGIPEYNICGVFRRNMLCGYSDPSGVLVMFDDVAHNQRKRKRASSRHIDVFEKEKIEESVVALLVQLRQEKMDMFKKVTEIYKSKIEKNNAERAAIETELEKMEIQKVAILKDDDISAEETALICSFIDGHMFENMLKLNEVNSDLKNIISEENTHMLLESYVERLDIAINNPKICNIPEFAREYIRQKDADLANVFFHQKSTIANNETSDYIQSIADEYMEKVSKLREEGRKLNSDALDIKLTRVSIPDGERSRKSETLHKQANARFQESERIEALAKTMMDIAASKNIFTHPDLVKLPADVRRIVRNKGGASGSKAKENSTKTTAKEEDNNLDRDAYNRMRNDNRTKTDKAAAANESESEKIATTGKDVGKSKKADISKLDPPWCQWIITPLAPFRKSNGKFIAKMPHEYVLEYFQYIRAMDPMRADVMSDITSIDELTPWWIFCSFEKAVANFQPLLHGVDYPYEWYPYQLTEEENNRYTHKYYVTCVNRIHYLGHLIKCKTFPLNIRKQLVLMQDTHLAMCHFMHMTKMYSDEELDKPATYNMNEAESTEVFARLQRVREFGQTVLKEETERPDRVTMLTYYDLYKPDYNWVFHEGELPNLISMIERLPYWSEKPSMDGESYDEAYKALLKLFDKTTERPMKGRFTHVPTRDYCEQHPMVYECLVRIYHCSLGGYYKHSNVIVNFAVRHALYRWFVMERVSPKQFSEWLYGHETIDPVLNVDLFVDHNCTTNKLLKEFTHCMIEKAPGMASFFNKYLHFRPMVENVRNATDLMREVLNDVFDGCGYNFLRVHVRYEKYCCERVKNTTIKTQCRKQLRRMGVPDSEIKDPRKTGRSAALSCIRSDSRSNIASWDKLEESWMGSSALRNPSDDADAIMYHEGNFPHTGEKDLIEFQESRMFNQLQMLGAEELSTMKNTPLLATIDVRIARDLTDRSNNIRAHEEFLEATGNMHKTDRLQEIANLTVDIRPNYRILHAEALVGRPWESGTCECPHCKEKGEDARTAFRNYQLAMANGDLGAAVMSHTTLCLIENALHWLAHQTNLEFQYRMCGESIDKFTLDRFKLSDLLNKNNAELEQAANDVTDDELALISMIAEKNKDCVGVPFQWMVLPDIAANANIIRLFENAIQLYTSASYTSDVQKVIECMAIQYPREYQLLKYYFVCLYQLRSFRTYALPYDVTMRQIRALHEKHDLVADGEPLPDCADLYYVCTVHGVLKTEITDSSPKAIHSIGSTNVCVNPMTGDVYCKHASNKACNMLVRSAQHAARKKKNKSSTDDMDDENSQDENDDADSEDGDDFNEEDFMGLMDCDDIETEDICDNSNGKEVEGAVGIAGSSIQMEEIISVELPDIVKEKNARDKTRNKNTDNENEQVRKIMQEFRMSTQQHTAETCMQKPLVPVHMIGTMVVLYEKAIILCPKCATPTLFTPEKFNEFDICCNMCVQRLRQDMPKNIAEFIMCVCTGCTVTKLYRTNEVAKYTVLDDTIPGMRRMRDIYLCKSCDVNGIGKYACTMNLTSILQYIHGAFYLKEDGKGGASLIQTHFSGKARTQQEIQIKKKKRRSVKNAADHAIVPKWWVQ